MASACEASKVQVVEAPAKSTPEAGDWRNLPLYMSKIGTYDGEAVLDVLKLANRTTKMKNAPIKSLSNGTCAVKDALDKDEYNLKLINNLGAMYLSEGQNDRALNVLMRGWKRANEICDERVRFRLLMKVAELSMYSFLYRQLLAVFRDIKEPADGDDLRSYLILGTQAWASNGDLTQSLKFFQRSIDREGPNRAIRIFAVVCCDLRKAGAYEAAKGTLENSLGANEASRGAFPDLTIVDDYMRTLDVRKTEITPAQLQRRITIGIAAFGVVIFFLLLWWLESRSLAAMK